MVIFVLAMVITILMTIASTLKVVFGWSENCHFRHRHTLGERTDKGEKPLKPSLSGQTPEMYIYTLSEKTLRSRFADRKSALASWEPFLPFYPFTFLPFKAFFYSAEKSATILRYIEYIRVRSI